MDQILIIAGLIIIVYFIIAMNKRHKSIYRNSDEDSIKPTQEIEPATNSIEESDYNDNYWIPVESKEREVKLKLFIKYKNTRSVISEREFDLGAFSRGPKGYHLHGFCHNKQQYITLSSLGVLKVTDLETNEPINNLIDFVEEKYKSTIDYKQDLLFDKYGLNIYILLYLSATSGSILKEEREIIIDYIKSIGGFEELTNEWLNDTINNLHKPGKMEIRNWIKKGLTQNYDYKSVLPWIDKLSLLQLETNNEFQNLRKYVLRKLEGIQNGKQENYPIAGQ